MREIWGLIPAAGKAKRLRRDAQGHLRKGPSKEILALPRADAATEGPARIACQDLLDNFRLAGVARALVLLRSGKWDIPKRLGDGGEFGVELAYRVLPAEQAARGVPFTLASAVPFLGDRMAALGFPDLQVQPRGNPLPAKQSRQYGNFRSPAGGFGPEIGLARALRAKEAAPGTSPQTRAVTRTAAS